jgi:hypothetical protein
VASQCSPVGELRPTTRKSCAAVARGQGLPLGGAEVPGDQHMVKKMEERLDLVLIDTTVLQGA